MLIFLDFLKLISQDTINIAMTMQDILPYSGYICLLNLPVQKGNIGGFLKHLVRKGIFLKVFLTVIFYILS